MFTTFYHNSVRNLVVAFGSLFNDIEVDRKNADGTTKERVKVPIAYGPKEKFLRRITEPSSISDDIKTQITLPRLGFEITGMDYDPEVPYNFTFQLSAMVRHMDDGLQITEQILPYFTPEFNVSLNFNSLHTKVDVPIILQSSTIVEDYEGDFDSRRSIQFDFSFLAKSYVYGPVKTSKIIREVDIKFLDTEDFTTTGGVSGATAALSRVITTVTGPSGSSSGINNYSSESTTFVQGASMDVAGVTYA